MLGRIRKAVSNASSTLDTLKDGVRDAVVDRLSNMTSSGYGGLAFGVGAIATTLALYSGERDEIDLGDATVYGYRKVGNKFFDFLRQSEGDSLKGAYYNIPPADKEFNKLASEKYRDNSLFVNVGNNKDFITPEPLKDKVVKFLDNKDITGAGSRILHTKVMVDFNRDRAFLSTGNIYSMANLRDGKYESSDFGVEIRNKKDVQELRNIMDAFAAAGADAKKASRIDMSKILSPDSNFIATGFGSGPGATKKIADMITGAKRKDIFVTEAYLDDPTIARSLIQAAQSGKNVTVLSRNNLDQLKPSDAKRIRVLQDLVEGGVDVQMSVADNPIFQHSKTIIADSFLMGSINYSKAGMARTKDLSYNMQGDKAVEAGISLFKQLQREGKFKSIRDNPDKFRDFLSFDSDLFQTLTGRKGVTRLEDVLNRSFTQIYGTSKNRESNVVGRPKIMVPTKLPLEYYQSVYTGRNPRMYTNMHYSLYGKNPDGIDRLFLGQMDRQLAPEGLYETILNGGLGTTKDPYTKIAGYGILGSAMAAASMKIFSEKATVGRSAKLIAAGAAAGVVASMVAISKPFGDLYQEGDGILSSTIKGVGRLFDILTGQYAHKRFQQEMSGKTQGTLGGMHRKYYDSRKDDSRGMFETVAAFGANAITGTTTAIGFYFGVSHSISLFKASLEEKGASRLLEALTDPGSGVIDKTAKYGMFSRELIDFMDTIPGANKTGKEVNEAFKEIFDSAFNSSSLNSYAPDSIRGRMVSMLRKKYGTQPIPAAKYGGMMQETFGYTQSTKSFDLSRTLTSSKFGTQQSTFEYLSTVRRLDSFNFSTFTLPILNHIAVYDEVLEGADFRAALTNLSKVITESPTLTFSTQQPNSPGVFLNSRASIQNFGYTRLENIARAFDDIAKYIPISPLYYIPQVRQMLGVGSLRQFDDAGKVIAGSGRSLGDFLGPSFSSVIMSTGKRVGYIFDSIISNGFGKYAEEINEVFKIEHKIQAGEALVGERAREVMKNNIYPIDYRTQARQGKSRAGFATNRSSKATARGVIYYMENGVIKSKPAPAATAKLRSVPVQRLMNEVVSNVVGDPRIQSLIGDPNDYQRIRALSRTKFIQKQRSLDNSFFANARRKFALVGMLAITDKITASFLMQNQGVDDLTVRSHSIIQAVRDAASDFAPLFFKEKIYKKSIDKQYESSGALPAYARYAALIGGAYAGGYLLPRFEYVAGSATILRDIVDPDNLSEKPLKVKGFKQRFGQRGWEADPKNPAKYKPRSSRNAPRNTTQPRVDSQKFLNRYTKPKVKDGVTAKFTKSRPSVRFSNLGAFVGALASTALLYGVAAFIGGTFRPPTDGRALDVDPMKFQTAIEAITGIEKETASGRFQDPRDIGNQYAVFALATNLIRSSQEQATYVYSSAFQVPNPVFQLAFTSKLDTNRNTLELGGGVQFLPILGVGATPTLPLTIKFTFGDNVVRQKSKAIFKRLQSLGSTEETERHKFNYGLITGLDSFLNLGNVFGMNTKSVFFDSLNLIAGLSLSKGIVNKYSGLITGRFSKTKDYTNLKPVLQVGKAVASTFEKLVRYAQTPAIAMVTAIPDMIRNVFKVAEKKPGVFSRINTKVLSPFLLPFVITMAKMNSDSGVSYMGYEAYERAYKNYDPIAMIEHHGYRLSAGIVTAGIMGYNLTKMQAFSDSADFAGATGAGGGVFNEAKRTIFNLRQDDYLRRVYSASDLALELEAQTARATTNIINARTVPNPSTDLTPDESRLLRKQMDDYILANKRSPKYLGHFELSKANLVRQIPSRLALVAPAVFITGAVMGAIGNMLSMSVNSDVYRTNMLIAPFRLAAGIDGVTSAEEISYRRSMGVESGKAAPKNVTELLANIVGSFNPFSAIGSLGKTLGLYQDEPNPFINLIGAAGVSGSLEDLKFYTQIQSTQADASSSVYKMNRAFISDDLMMIMKSIQKQGRGTMFRKIMGSVPRSAPMSIRGGTTASERARLRQAGAGLSTAAAIRAYAAQNLRQQRSVELNFAFFAESARLGKVVTPGQKNNIPHMYSPVDFLNTTFVELSDGVNPNAMQSYLKGLSSLLSGLAKGPEKQMDFTGLIYDYRPQINDPLPLISYFSDVLSYANNLNNPKSSSGYNPISSTGFILFNLAFGITTFFGVAFGLGITGLGLATALEGGTLTSLTREVVAESDKLRYVNKAFVRDGQRLIYGLQAQANSYMEIDEKFTKGKSDVEIDRLANKLNNAIQTKIDVFRTIADPPAIVGTKAKANFAEKLLDDSLPPINRIDAYQKSLTSRIKSNLGVITQTRITRIITKDSSGKLHTVLKPVRKTESKFLSMFNITADEFNTFLDDELLKHRNNVDNIINSGDSPEKKRLKLKLERFKLVNSINDFIFNKPMTGPPTQVQNPSTLPPNTPTPDRTQMSKTVVSAADVIENYGLTGTAMLAGQQVLKFATGLFAFSQVYEAASLLSATSDGNTLGRRQAAVMTAYSISMTSMVGAGVAISRTFGGLPAIVVGAVALYAVDQLFNKGRATQAVLKELDYINRNYYIPFVRKFGSGIESFSRLPIVETMLSMMRVPFSVTDPFFNAIKAHTKSSPLLSILYGFLLPETKDTFLENVMGILPSKSTGYGERLEDYTTEETRATFQSRAFARRARALAPTVRIDEELVHAYLLGGLSGYKEDILYSQAFDSGQYADRILASFYNNYSISALGLSAIKSRQQLMGIMADGLYVKAQPESFSVMPAAALLSSGFSSSLLTTGKSLTLLIKVADHIAAALDSEPVRLLQRIFDPMTYLNELFTMFGEFKKNFVDAVQTATTNLMTSIKSRLPKSAIPSGFGAWFAKQNQRFKNAITPGSKGLAFNKALGRATTGGLLVGAAVGAVLGTVQVVASLINDDFGESIRPYLDKFSIFAMVGAAAIRTGIDTMALVKDPTSRPVLNSFFTNGIAKNSRSLAYGLGGGLAIGFTASVLRDILGKTIVRDIIGPDKFDKGTNIAVALAYGFGAYSFYKASATAQGAAPNFFKLYKESKANPIVRMIDGYKRLGKVIGHPAAIGLGALLGMSLFNKDDPDKVRNTLFAGGMLIGVGILTKSVITIPSVRAVSVISTRYFKRAYRYVTKSFSLPKFAPPGSRLRGLITSFRGTLLYNLLLPSNKLARAALNSHDLLAIYKLIANKRGIPSYVIDSFSRTGKPNFGAIKAFLIGNSPKYRRELFETTEVYLRQSATTSNAAKAFMIRTDVGRFVGRQIRHISKVVPRYAFSGLDLLFVGTSAAQLTGLKDKSTLIQRENAYRDFVGTNIAVLTPTLVTAFGMLYKYKIGAKASILSTILAQKAFTEPIAMALSSMDYKNNKDAGMNRLLYGGAAIGTLALVIPTAVKVARIARAAAKSSTFFANVFSKGLAGQAVPSVFLAADVLVKGFHSTRKAFQNRGSRSLTHDISMQIADSLSQSLFALAIRSPTSFGTTMYTGGAIGISVMEEQFKNSVASHYSKRLIATGLMNDKDADMIRKSMALGKAGGAAVGLLVGVLRLSGKGRIVSLITSTTIGAAVGEYIGLEAPIKSREKFGLLGFAKEAGYLALGYAAFKGLAAIGTAIASASPAAATVMATVGTVLSAKALTVGALVLAADFALKTGVSYVEDKVASKGYKAKKRVANFIDRNFMTVDTMFSGRKYYKRNADAPPVISNILDFATSVSRFFTGSSEGEVTARRVDNYSRRQVGAGLKDLNYKQSMFSTALATTALNTVTPLFKNYVSTEQLAEYTDRSFEAVGGMLSRIVGKNVTNFFDGIGKNINKGVDELGKDWNELVGGGKKGIGDMVKNTTNFFTDTFKRISKETKDVFSRGSSIQHIFGTNPNPIPPLEFGAPDFSKYFNDNNQAKTLTQATFKSFVSLNAPTGLISSLLTSFFDKVATSSLDKQGNFKIFPFLGNMPFGSNHDPILEAENKRLATKEEDNWWTKSAREVEKARDFVVKGAVDTLRGVRDGTVKNLRKAKRKVDEAIEGAQDFLFGEDDYGGEYAGVDVYTTGRLNGSVTSVKLTANVKASQLLPHHREYKTEFGTPFDFTLVDRKTGQTMGVPIRAPIALTVRSMLTQPGTGYGNFIDLVDDKGKPMLRLAHLKAFGEGLKAGQKVQAGTILGYQGNSGSEAIHIHAESKRPDLVELLVARSITGDYGGRVGRTTSKLAAVSRMAQNLGVTTQEMAAIIAQESRGFAIDSKGGTGNEYEGLIQWGANERVTELPGLLRKIGLTGNEDIRKVPFEKQLLLAELWVKGRGFKKGMGQDRLYNTINGGNPWARKERDGFGTMSLGNKRIQPGGDKYDEGLRWIAAQMKLAPASPTGTKQSDRTSNAPASAGIPDTLKYDVKRAAEIADMATKYAGPSSIGACFRYVADATKAVFGKDIFSGASAKFGAGQLAKNRNFAELTVTKDTDFSKLPLGAIIVYGQRVNPNVHNGAEGHIEVVIRGGKAASDFIQPLANQTKAKVNSNPYSSVRVFVSVMPNTDMPNRLRQLPKKPTSDPTVSRVPNPSSSKPSTKTMVTPPSRKGLIIKLTPTSQIEKGTGLRLFELSLVDNRGQKIDSMLVRSGKKDRQELTSLQSANSYAGDKRPIPEGTYLIGAASRDESKRNTDIGAFWAPVTKQGSKDNNNRGDFGIHLDADANKPGGLGSIGCVALVDEKQIQKLESWLKTFNPEMLLVDYNLETINALAVELRKQAARDKGSFSKETLETLNAIIRAGNTVPTSKVPKRSKQSIRLDEPKEARPDPGRMADPLVPKTKPVTVKVAMRDDSGNVAVGTVLDAIPNPAKYQDGCCESFCRDLCSEPAVVSTMNWA